MNGDQNANLTLTLTDLATTDVALPNTWDSRHKKLLDNDAILHKRLGDIETGAAPARALQITDDLQALRAYTPPRDRVFTVVPGHGTYRYSQQASAPEAVPQVIRCDSGVGRWVLDALPFSLLGAPAGVATLNGQGFLNQSVPDGAIGTGKIAAGAVTDDRLADVTINDQNVPNTNTGRLSWALGAIANMITRITGKATWRTFPATTIEELNTNVARKNQTNTFTSTQRIQGELSVRNGYGDELYLGGDAGGEDYEIRLMNPARPLIVWSPSGPATFNVSGRLQVNGVDVATGTGGTVDNTNKLGGIPAGDYARVNITNTFTQKQNFAAGLDVNNGTMLRGGATVDGTLTATGNITANNNLSGTNVYAVNFTASNAVLFQRGATVTGILKADNVQVNSYVNAGGFQVMPGGSYLFTPIPDRLSNEFRISSSKSGQYASDPDAFTIQMLATGTLPKFGINIGVSPLNETYLNADAHRAITKNGSPIVTEAIGVAYDAARLGGMAASEYATKTDLNNVSSGNNGAANLANTFDLILGSFDQSTRGNTGQSRALVKDSGSTLVLNFGGDFAGGVRVDGPGIFQGSRRSLKQGITPYERSAVDVLQAVEIVRYAYKTNPDAPRIGFIADDTDADLAGTGHDRYDVNNITAVLIKAVQELSAQNRDLHERIRALGA